ncbi:MAG: SgcJ/EcaC family oxidoreductase [Ginsengibacter sp.]
MKKIVLAIFALSFGPVLNLRAQSGDEIAIKNVATKFETVFNQKDAKETAKFWAEDGDFINYLGELLHGRDEIEKYFRAAFTRYYQTAHNNLFEPTIRFLTPGIAAVDVKWEVTGATSADGKPKAAFKGIMVWTMTKESGDWFIKIMHNVTLPE